MSDHPRVRAHLRLAGIFCALFTPYDRRGEVDCGVLGQLADHVVRKGVHGFYLCGSTGEGLLLDLDQRMRIVENVLARVPARFPTIVHVGALTTRDACDLARHAAQAGAAAVSAVPPFGGEFGPRDVARHYAAIAEAAALPFYAYYIPGRHYRPMSSRAFYDTLKDVPFLAGGKIFHRDLAFLSEVTDLSDGRWNILTGYDDLLLEGLAAGADGAIGSTYNVFPELAVRSWDLYQAGDVEDALAIQRRLRRFWMRANTVVSTRAGRYLLERQGFVMGRPRPPIQPLSAAEKGLVRRALRRLRAELRSLHPSEA